jgi:hypothetical protein
VAGEKSSANTHQELLFLSLPCNKAATSISARRRGSLALLLLLLALRASERERKMQPKRAMGNSMAIECAPLFRIHSSAPPRLLLMDFFILHAKVHK